MVDAPASVLVYAAKRTSAHRNETLDLTETCSGRVAARGGFGDGMKRADDRWYRNGRDQELSVPISSAAMLAERRKVGCRAGKSGAP